MHTVHKLGKPSGLAQQLFLLVRKRAKLWHFASLALVAIVLILMAWRALGNAPSPQHADKIVLDSLAAYDLRYELNDDSRVIRVMLEGSQVTDSALDELVNLPYLKSLELQKSSVTDAGLLKIKKLKHLQNLGIVDTAVTDLGISYLEGMYSLRNIWLRENETLTAQGIASLKQAMPGLKVHVINRPKGRVSARK